MAAPFTITPILAAAKADDDDSWEVEAEKSIATFCDKVAEEVAAADAEKVAKTEAVAKTAAKIAAVKEQTAAIMAYHEAKTIALKATAKVAADTVANLGVAVKAAQRHALREQTKDNIVAIKKLQEELKIAEDYATKAANKAKKSAAKATKPMEEVAAKVAADMEAEEVLTDAEKAAKIARRHKIFLRDMYLRQKAKERNLVGY